MFSMWEKVSGAMVERESEGERKSESEGEREYAGKR
jgi:hypothetical protein